MGRRPIHLEISCDASQAVAALRRAQLRLWFLRLRLWFHRVKVR